MPDYTFETLSSAAFEDVSRDLLQAEWGVSLESFMSGRDGGVDMRYAKSEDGTTIVQCKQYARSGYSKLKSALENEIPKVKKLDPKRYVVATSVGMTPPRKDEIAGLFAATEPHDVYGREDFNNLLGQFPEVEKRHPVLWLASTAVLEEVLERTVHAGLHTAKALAEREIQRVLQVFAPNRSLPLAQALLEEHHTCVIAGEPGIGKTTLASVLITDHLLDGYELIVAHGDIQDALPFLDPERKQILYYDDFLGRTSAHPSLEKNEDQTIVAIARLARESPTTRFLLTTREYILQQAKQAYERIAHSDLTTFTVELAHYTRPIRARILYNHLHAAGLTQPYLDAVVRDKGYLRIVDHPNYNPRVIERMTTDLRAPQPEPDEYLDAFVGLLDDPDVIWRHAYEHDFSDAHRHLLLVFATLPDTVDLDDLEKAFWAFHTLRSERHNAPTSTLDFQNALRVLDGDLLHTARQKYRPDRREVSARSPAVQDFLHRHLLGHSADVADLAEAVMFYEQAVVLQGSYSPPLETIARALAERLGAPPLRRPGVLRQHGPIHRRGSVDVVRRGVQALEAAKRQGDLESYGDLTERVVDAVLGAPPSNVDSDAAARLPHLLSEPPLVEYRTDDLLRRIALVLSRNVDSLDRVETFRHFRDRFPGTVAEEVEESVRDDFAYYVEAEVRNIEDNASGTDPDEIKDYMDRLKHVMFMEGWSFEEDWLEVLDQAKGEAQYEWDKVEDFWSEHGGGVAPSQSQEQESSAEIDALFESLAHSQEV